MKKVLSIILMVAIGLSICSAVYASDVVSKDLSSANKETIFPIDDIKTIDKVVGREEADALAEEGIMPLGILCECGGNMDVIDRHASPWVFVGNTQCPHGVASHVCKKYERTVSVTWKCNDCPYGYTQSYKEINSYCTY